MSKIQGKPFVETVLNTLDKDGVNDLLKLLNGKEQTPLFRSLINKTNYITSDDKDKIQYITLETWNRVYSGYLVYNDDYCVLFGFNLNNQELSIVNINNTTFNSYQLVKEQLSILELRSYINDLLVEAGELVKVQADDIDSEEATAGQALLADGSGGAEWGTVEALPEITAGDEGKALVVDDGEATWGDAGFSITNLAPAYNSATSYVAGDLCTYNNTLYECNASTTGDFDATKWDATNIAAAVLGLLNVGV